MPMFQYILNLAKASMLLSFWYIFKESFLLPFNWQGNSDWVDWQTNVLLKRNAVENVSQWACGLVFINMVSSACSISYIDYARETELLHAQRALHICTCTLVSDSSSLYYHVHVSALFLWPRCSEIA